MSLFDDKVLFIFKALEDQKVEYIFGYPGGAVLPIYDELKNHKSIKHILARHEQGAGHSAEGYARSVSYTHLRAHET